MIIEVLKMDGQAFLQVIETNMNTEDEIIQKFVLDILHKSYIGDENTFLIGLEANEQYLQKENIEGSLLPYLEHLPVSHRGVEYILERLRNNTVSKEQQPFYTDILNHLDPCLAKAYQHLISQVFKKQGIQLGRMDFYTSLCTDQRDIVLQKFHKVIHTLEVNGTFDKNVFILGKQIASLMVHREMIGALEIIHRIKKMKSKSILSYRDLYDVVLASEMRLGEAVPEILALAQWHYRNELFLEEMCYMLIKVGAEENSVIESVKALIHDPRLSHYAIYILSNIKTVKAREALVQGWEHVQGKTEKTMIAAGLCEHLTVDMLSKIDSFIQHEGYDEAVATLEEGLYCMAVIHDIDHPEMARWKASLQERQKVDNGVEEKGEETRSNDRENHAPNKEEYQGEVNDEAPEQLENQRLELTEQSADIVTEEELHRDEVDEGNEAIMVRESTYSQEMEEDNDTILERDTPFSRETEATHEEIKAAVERIYKAGLRRKQVKVGRNDPCPCGSGHKYKKCCM
ncbi:SEC-C metal-binding domain-containing protein [Salipaludibacillus agaradhaerens]|uniref:SEC-C metal-binding domain-containing protein n=1 Tax=Salipaludibacillus agaradhaerens TaxID=76935 RepID=UPI002151B0AB|nr:SEC-C metal-binding domain-containing protein [Salipaludibacillus agaradhaerens]